MPLFNSIRITICVAVMMAFGHVGAHIELVTVPKSQSVQLTIYNSADITMVRESRELTFKRGMNTLQFSWAGTLIDPTSLRITFLNEKSKLRLSNTAFPPGRTDALQWHIESELSGPARVEINYFTSGITWNADYTAITTGAEKSMSVDGFVRVVNNSGEDYLNAEVRLVVGTVNLVEKIAELARGSWRYGDLNDNLRAEVRNQFYGKIRLAEKERAPAKPAPAPEVTTASTGRGYFDKPKDIIKEGLSEYFLFTVEGRESIPNGWQKRLRAFSARDVPVKVIYRATDRKNGGAVHKFYEFRNVKEAGQDPKTSLGVSPLPDGKVHIFAEDGQNNLSYQGGSRTEARPVPRGPQTSMSSGIYMKYAATGDKVKLDSGPTREVVLRTFVRDFKRTDFVTDTRYNKTHFVKEWVDTYFYESEIENTLSRPVSIEIERTFPGNFEPANLPFKFEKVDAATIRFFPDVNAREKKSIPYAIKVVHKE